jgi:hypothetical protein
LRKQINEMLPDEQKVTVNDLIVKAAALALRDFPNINASFGGETLIRHNNINVGTAVAVENGLMTVVQKNTDTSTLSKIAADNKRMIAGAREGKVSIDDIEGATFTVSNLGAFDVDSFVAIINPPEAAILAVGTASQVPVVRDGEMRISPLSRWISTTIIRPTRMKTGNWPASSTAACATAATAPRRSRGARSSSCTTPSGRCSCPTATSRASAPTAAPPTSTATTANPAARPIRRPN